MTRPHPLPREKNLQKTIRQPLPLTKKNTPNTPPPPPQKKKKKNKKQRHLPLIPAPQASDFECMPSRTLTQSVFTYRNIIT